MTLKRFIPLALMLSTALPVLSQVQLFEAEVSGIVPFGGVKWNSGITEWVAGIEYNIDGRTTLGLTYGQPLKDTLTFDKDLKSYTLNPYAIFEFIEPDNLKSFSFAIRVDYIQEDTKAKPKGTEDRLKYNSFSRTHIGGGPIFALRLFSSDKLVLIPSAGYEFFYVESKRNQLASSTDGNFPKETFLWHDVMGSCSFHFLINEFNGLNFEPKVIAKFGKTRSSKDMLNVTANLGYVKAF
ncbi:MAG: hypothetical protein M3Y08_08340 [Fibrobacterota bacterium]|nr:hypothetical protein [Fibrobacterota bacterium]